jgi:hypothetical protein
MTMNAKLKKLVVILIITIILLSFTQANLDITFSGEIGGKIDLFTQKEPYSGKGLHMPSEAFGLGEVVILYALVTHNEGPLQNLLVTFYVRIPDDTSFSLTVRTNASGIAIVNFTIPQKCANENEIFGEWFALANVLIGDYVFQDTLTFDVDWIIKLISVRTIDENLTYRTSFGKVGDVGLEIALRSIAMRMKSTMLAIVIQDELNVPINCSEIRNFEVQPNEKIIFLYCKLHIPKWAYVGKATVFISALTAPVNQSGVPYCPAISASFFIMPYEPLTIAFHDVAVVNVVPSATSVELGQPLSINVSVRNEGTEVESFNVSAYSDGVSIGTLKVTALSPYSKVTLTFTLDTSSVDAGNCTISASIPYLLDEADLTDNTFVDGTIEIKPELPTIVHDIAIVDINISNNSVYIGDLLQINVSVVNKGTETEAFNVSTYHDSSLVETLQVSALAPGAQATLIFMWNTSSVREGFYQISAFAPLSSDIDVSDNTFVDDVVQVKAKPTPPPVHDVAVLNVVPSSLIVYVRETLYINVTLKNKGSEVESFNVTLYYDSNGIDTLLVNDLTAGAEYTHIFRWDTYGISEGNYTLSAFAEPVPGEENTGDNHFEDGVVKIVEAPKGWYVPDWFCWLLLLLLVLILFLLIIWLYRRKRRKKAEEAFYSGWTAWYYGYDLRGEIYGS